MKTVAEETKENVNTRAHKGGRRKKRQHLDQKLTVMCSRFDVITIRHYAKGFNMSLSEYLRLSGLKRQVDRKVKSLPKEVLQLIGTLNHLAANLNQIAYRRNRGDDLNAFQRAEVMVLAGELKVLAKMVKAALR